MAQSKALHSRSNKKTGRIVPPFFKGWNKMIKSNDKEENLLSFVQNGGLIDPERPPQINEPFYMNWMAEKIKQMSLKNGDTLSVVVSDRTGKEQQISGILIDDMYLSTELKLLTKGKKLWKSRENEESVWLSSIVSIEKIEDAPLDFNSKEVNPYYRTKDELESARAESAAKKHVIHEREIEMFKNAYPGLDFCLHKILCLGFSIYFPYSNGSISGAHINIVKNDRTTVRVPDIKIKQIYPNRNYYSVCGTEKKSEYIFVPFANIEELQDVKYISCLWKIKLDNDREIHVLYLSYPTFKENKHRDNIFNVGAHDTVLSVHEESLHANNVFSGNIYVDYDFVGVLYNEEDMLLINGELSEDQELDMLMALHNADLKEVVASLGAQGAEHVEVFMKKEEIKSTHFFSDSGTNHVEHAKRIKEKLDFSRFL